ncbi:hypothetical protein PIB30_077807 [Stylosanthes scabra]|uniref:Uncharacterized protein n=1 Tax=Stylosanthes scabra TaxID=79078 RepID=A0ABU6YN90_9FABA|nr:hypothetical protein [Stylosanthes scabra]
MEPCLTMLDEAERQNSKLVGDLKALNLQKVFLEEQVAEVAKVKEKLEGDLKSAEKNFESLRKDRDGEITRLQLREKELEFEVGRLKGLVADEKARADRSRSSISDLEKECIDLAEDAKGAVAATETALKAQLAILLPDFDSSQIGFFQDIVDGKVVDLPVDRPS